MHLSFFFIFRILSIFNTNTERSKGFLKKFTSKNTKFFNMHLATQKYKQNREMKIKT